jgi:hypothetical protein
MPSRPLHRIRLNLETLEDRTCPSISTSLLDQGHTLVINGDNQGDHVWLTQNDDRDELLLYWFPNDGQIHPQVVQESVFQSSAIQKVVLNLRGGDDTFDFNVEGSGLTYGKEFLVNLGSGNDRASFDFAGASLPAPGLPIRANVKIVLAAGGGADEVTASFGQIAAGRSATLLADLGSGNDTAAVTLHGDVAAGASLNLALIGGLGKDSLSTTTGAAARIEMGAVVNVLLDGRQGSDVLNQYFAGYLGGHLNARLTGGEGVDVLGSQIVASWDSSGQANIGLSGGTGKDQLLLLTSVTPPPEDIAFILPWTPALKMKYAVDGGLGFDRAEVAAGTLVRRCEQVTVQPINIS